jgi:hypothetical protein
MGCNANRSGDERHVRGVPDVDADNPCGGYGNLLHIIDDIARGMDLGNRQSN